MATEVTSEARHEPPTPGAPGIGDPLYPTLGNGGYDVQHYHLDLRYATAAPDQVLDGTILMFARATQALSQLNVDFAGDSYGEVTVDGCAASTQWDGSDIVITPSRSIRRGDYFVVRIAHFAATPLVPNPEEFLNAPFFVTADGTAWAGQPHNAHRIFPSNDHPRDKASFTFRIDVPAGTTAVANGVLEHQRTIGDRSIWRYEQRQPMPTELAQVAVGAYTVIDRGRHAGVDFRDVVPSRVAAELAPRMAGALAHMDFLEERLGRYPFDTYGSLAVEAGLGFALETQTLSLFEVAFFQLEPRQYEPIMVHELAHQWFGNSVAPASWSDVWQNEGHATLYEVMFQIDIDSPEFLEEARQAYALGDLFRFAFGPVAAPRSGNPIDVFNPNVYVGGAITLLALRNLVGDETFTRIEREWVRHYRGKSASTQDFIALASRVANQDLTQFLNDWLYGMTTPPMPGHPDWTVDPLPTGFAPAAAAVQLPPLWANAMHDRKR